MPQPHHHTVRHGHIEHAVAPKPLWVIDRQELDRQFVPGSDPIEVWTVYFTTRNGVEAWVTIPREVYTAEVVATALTHEAELLDSVARLEGAK